MSCQHRHDAAVYVLGALDAADRERFEQHLRTCDDCSRMVRQLADMPGVLAHAPVEDLEAEPESPPDSLLPNLVRTVRRKRRMRRWRMMAMAVAGAAVLFAGTAALEQAWRSGEPEQAQVVAMAAEFESTSPADYWGTARLIEHDAGTEIRLNCSYGAAADPSRQYTVYQLLVTNDAGQTDTAGSWFLRAEGSAQPSLFTHIPVERITSMEIQYIDGSSVMTWHR